MNIWGALFLAPVVFLVIISPAEMLLLGLGAVGYAALLWLAHKAIGKK